MSTYMPEINVDVPCNPADLVSKLEKDLERELAEFGNVLKNSKVWGNPLITAGISQLLGAAATFGNDILIDKLLESDLISDILKRGQDYISIVMTVDPQMKLAAGYLLVQNLKQDLKNRINVLETMNEKLGYMETFIKKWDYYSVAGQELRKLRSAERHVKVSKARMKRAQAVLNTFQRYSGATYEASVKSIKSAGNELETRYVDPTRPDLFVYWEKWWDSVQEDLINFAENSIDVLSMLPADQKIMEDVFPEWSSIYGLLALRFSKEATNLDKSPSWLQDFAKREINRMFKAKELIPVNKTIRSLLGEIKNLDTTWADMAKYASTISNGIDTALEEITKIHDKMYNDAYIVIPTEVKLAAKNALYLTQLRTLYIQLVATKEIVKEYDDLLQDFVAMEILVELAREYPDFGKHPAETIADMIFKSYESIIFGFFSEGGSRNALIQIANIKRRIRESIRQDQYLLNNCNAFDALDNALIEEALTLYKSVTGNVTNLLEQVGNSPAVNALIKLDFGNFNDLLWSKMPTNRCAAKEAIGEPAESTAEMGLKQNQRKLNWTKSLIAKMDWIKDPVAAIKDNLGLSMLGE